MTEPSIQVEHLGRGVAIGDGLGEAPTERDPGPGEQFLFASGEVRTRGSWWESLRRHLGYVASHADAEPRPAHHALLAEADRLVFIRSIHRPSAQLRGGNYLGQAIFTRLEVGAGGSGADVAAAVNMFRPGVFLEEPGPLPPTIARQPALPLSAEGVAALADTLLLTMSALRARRPILWVVPRAEFAEAAPGVPPEAFTRMLALWRLLPGALRASVGLTSLPSSAVALLDQRMMLAAVASGMDGLDDVVAARSAIVVEPRRGLPRLPPSAEDEAYVRTVVDRFEDGWGAALDAFTVTFPERGIRSVAEIYLPFAAAWGNHPDGDDAPFWAAVRMALTPETSANVGYVRAARQLAAEHLPPRASNLLDLALGNGPLAEVARNRLAQVDRAEAWNAVAAAAESGATDIKRRFNLVLRMAGGPDECAFSPELLDILIRVSEPRWVALWRSWHMEPAVPTDKLADALLRLAEEQRVAVLAERPRDESLRIELIERASPSQLLAVLEDVGRIPAPPAVWVRAVRRADQLDPGSVSEAVARAIVDAAAQIGPGLHTATCLGWAAGRLSPKDLEPLFERVAGEPALLLVVARYPDAMRGSHAGRRVRVLSELFLSHGKVTRSKELVGAWAPYVEELSSRAIFLLQGPGAPLEWDRDYGPTLLRRLAALTPSDEARAPFRAWLGHAATRGQMPELVSGAREHPEAVLTELVSASDSLPDGERRRFVDAVVNTFPTGWLVETRAAWLSRWYRRSLIKLSDVRRLVALGSDRGWLARIARLRGALGPELLNTLVADRVGGAPLAAALLDSDGTLSQRLAEWCLEAARLGKDPTDVLGLLDAIEASAAVIEEFRVWLWSQWCVAAPGQLAWFDRTLEKGGSGEIPQAVLRKWTRGMLDDPSTIAPRLAHRAAIGTAPDALWRRLDPELRERLEEGLGAPGLEPLATVLVDAGVRRKALARQLVARGESPHKALLELHDRSPSEAAALALSLRGYGKSPFARSLWYALSPRIDASESGLAILELYIDLVDPDSAMTMLFDPEIHSSNPARSRALLSRAIALRLDAEGDREDTHPASVAWELGVRLRKIEDAMGAQLEGVLDQVEWTIGARADGWRIVVRDSVRVARPSSDARSTA